MAFLEVSNIVKSFGKTEVLKGISFSLEKGEVLAIIGSSGSGKTTLLRCLNFLETADSGSFAVNGETLFGGEEPIKQNSKTLREKRLHFGLVFQSFNLFPHYNVLKNVRLAMDLKVSDKVKELRKQQKAEGKLKTIKDRMAAMAVRKKFADELYEKNKTEAETLIARVGLSDKLASYPCELSGGQCQRVAIARALALKPDILCFDEPTSALDPELTGEVLKVIRSLKSGDTTMIVVTHEMEFAKNVADKIIFMSDGVIEEEGTPSEVFGNPKSEKTRAFLAKSEERI